MKFWNGKWDLPLRHNNTAHWLKNVETQLREAKKQENITKNLKKKTATERKELEGSRTKRTERILD